MRHHTSQSENRTLWLAALLDWVTRDGEPFGANGSVTWMDDGQRWAILMPEEVV